MDEYKFMLVQTDYPHCWFCGRTAQDQPQGWFAPWVIERSHVVNKPRVEDRRVVVLLCPVCHRREHGQTLLVDDLPSPSLANMLWMKFVFDQQFWSPKFLRAHSIGNLPTAEPPPAEVRHAYARRQGSYPA
ncbi:MAG: hypothetical protein NXI32_09230 [bacterium]|nr:hypothetical protein [bacterium]